PPRPLPSSPTRRSSDLDLGPEHLDGEQAARPRSGRRGRERAGAGGGARRRGQVHRRGRPGAQAGEEAVTERARTDATRVIRGKRESEEHTSELQSPYDL